MTAISRRHFVGLLVGGTEGALLAGFPALANAADSKPGAPKVLTVAQGTDIKSLDPGDETIDHARNILLNLFDPLVARDNNMGFMPMLAESWKSVDAITWEFKLRRGVKFHNGQDFTAEDVKFTFERILSKDNNLRMRPLIGPFKGVEIVDPYTVRLVTTAPYPLVLSRLDRVFVVSSKTFQGQGKEALARKPVGTGPFKFVEWVHDDHLAMEKNPSYWRNQVKIDRIIWKPIPEAATRLAALVSGDAQISYPVDPEDVGVVKGNPELSVGTARGVRQFYIGLNHFEKPLDDVRVRRAIAHAIDVGSLIKTVMGDRAYRVNNVVGGPQIFGSDPNVKPYEFDPKLSRKLLAEAGMPNGLEIDFISPVGRLPKDAEVAQAVAGQLQKAGIKTKLQVLEFGTYQSLFANKKLKGLHVWSHGNVMMDADSPLYLNLSSRGRGIYYNSPKTDDLIDQARSTTDGKKRLQLYSEIERLMREDVAVIPMWEYQNIYGVSKRVTGFVARPDERIYVHDLDLK